MSLDREGDLNRPGNFGGSNASTQVQNDAFELIGNLEYARGLAHAELNQISEASDAYGRSRKAFTAVGSDDIDLAYLDRLDAAALGRTGRYGEALDVFRRAADTFSRLHFPQEVDGGILRSDQARSDDFPSALRPVFGIVDHRGVGHSHPARMAPVSPLLRVAATSDRFRPVSSLPIRLTGILTVSSCLSQNPGPGICQL